jgi:hypothetical protein
MILYAADGLQDIEIAAALECSPDSVARRRSRFCAERMDGLEAKARSGSTAPFPPRTWSPRSRAAALALLPG